MALNPGMEKEEVRELREGAWEGAFVRELERLGKTEADLATKPRHQPWKVELAWTVRKSCGASVVWLAGRLAIGRPASLRSYLCRHGVSQNQQTTA